MQSSYGIIACMAHATFVRLLSIMFPPVSPVPFQSGEPSPTNHTDRPLGGGATMIKAHVFQECLSVLIRLSTNAAERLQGLVDFEVGK